MHAIPNLDAKGLRQFAFTIGGIVAVLFGLVVPFLFGARFPQSIPWWPFAAAAVLLLWGLLAPRSLRPVYRAWMHLGLLLNRVTTPLILGLLFFLVFVPTGLMMRLAGHDPLRRRLTAETPTYRVPSRTATRDSMTRPF